MAYFGYVRVSTSKQVELGESIDTQAEVIRAFIHGAGEKGFTLHRDPGVSASIPIAERPGGAVLCKQLKSGDTLVVTKLDRLFRSTADSIQTTLRWNEEGVRLVVLSFGGGQMDTASACGRLMITLLSAFSEFEREMAGERTREAMRQIKASGRARSNMRPFGYVLTTDRRLRIMHPEHIILQQMIQDHEDGISMKKIAEKLNNCGITTANGARWDQSIVARNIKLELERRKIFCATS